MKLTMFNTAVFMLITAWALDVPRWYKIVATIIAVLDFWLVYIKLWAGEHDIELEDDL